MSRRVYSIGFVVAASLSLASCESCSLPVDAGLTASSSEVKTGEPVVFSIINEKVRNAAQAGPPQGATTEYRWDLDGDNVFEAETKVPRIEKRYEQAGAYFPQATVVYVKRGTGADVGLYASEVIKSAAPNGRGVEVVVTNQATGGGGTPPPALKGVNASFTPRDPGPPHQVRFISTSTDPDGGTIAGCQWSFGDGATGTGCDVTHEYATTAPGFPNFTVTLTVTDSQGETGRASRTVNAQAPETRSAPERAVAAAFSEATASAAASQRLTLSPSTRIRDNGVLRVVGQDLQVTGVVVGGRATIGGLPRFVRSRGKAAWAGSMTIRGNVSQRSGRASGHLLVSLPKRGRACLAASWTMAAGARSNRGKFTVVAGTKQAARLIGTGTFSLDAKGAFRGTHKFRQARAGSKPTRRRMPAACRSLARRL